MSGGGGCGEGWGGGEAEVSGVASGDELRVAPIAVGPGVLPASLRDAKRFGSVRCPGIPLRGYPRLLTFTAFAVSSVAGEGFL